MGSWQQRPREGIPWRSQKATTTRTRCPGYRGCLWRCCCWFILATSGPEALSTVSTACVAACLWLREPRGIEQRYCTFELRARVCEMLRVPDLISTSSSPSRCQTRVAGEFVFVEATHPLGVLSSSRVLLISLLGLSSSRSFSFVSVPRPSSGATR